MFYTWGRFVALHRRAVAIVSLLLIVAAIGVIATVKPDFSSEGYLSDNAESVRVDQTVIKDFGIGGPSLVFLFDLPDGQTVAGSGSDAQAKVDAALAPLAEDARLNAPLTTWTTGDSRFVSTDGSATYAVVYTKDGQTISPDETDTIIASVKDAAAAQGLTASAGGSLAVNAEINHEVERGLIRAETVAIPLTLIFLVLVFGTLVAAGLPLVIGGLGIVAAIAILFVASQFGFQSVFAVNVVTMLGLGRGIDYSLFMVTRFREELRKREPDEAVAVTMATTGKAILFSGITVIFGLAATMFFPLPALHSLGQAGIIVTACALIFGLSLLPALLVMLGRRVNRFALPFARERVSTETNQEAGLWYGIAHAVMARPLAFLIPLLVLLLIAGSPVLGLNLTPGGPEILSRSAEAREVVDRLKTEFGGSSDTVPVLLTFPGNPLTAEGAQEVQALAGQMATIPGVSSVDSFAVKEVPWAQWNGDVAALPQALQAGIAQTVRDNQVLVQVHTTVEGDELEQVARDLRAIPGNGVTIQVGGQAAAAVDTVDGVKAGILPAALFVAVGAYIILLFTFGSIFLPLKAMFMSLLSISASLGVVVLIFQRGWLQNLFGFEATGEVVAMVPILMFCVLFGLSMDYEVLMLSRIQEEYERTGDNRASVAFGLANTGRVITGAAAIMVVAFGGFVLAENVILKSLGFGLALAVLVDATIVRGLLVPSTMRLMGRWNWWAPGPVKRLVDRAGLSHHSDLPGGSGSGSGSGTGSGDGAVAASPTISPTNAA
ncbi:MAG: MMPL family transporter [Thermomicrobiales bacterium]